MNKFQRILLASGLAATASLIAPYANAQSITNATQLKVDLAANSISGIKQGGSAAISVGQPHTFLNKRGYIS